MNRDDDRSRSISPSQSADGPFCTVPGIGSVETSPITIIPEASWTSTETAATVHDAAARTTTTPAAPHAPSGPAAPHARRRGPRSAPPGVPYHRVLAGEMRRVGRGIVALTLLLGGLFLFGGVFAYLGSVVDTMLGRSNPMTGGYAFTPVFQAGNLIAIALLIPWSILIQRWQYGVRGASLHSVRSVFRFDVSATIRCSHFGQSRRLDSASVNGSRKLTPAGLRKLSKPDSMALSSPEFVQSLSARSHSCAIPPSSAVIEWPTGSK